MAQLIEAVLYFGIIVSSSVVLFTRYALVGALALAVNTSLIGFLLIKKDLLFIGLGQIAVYAGGIIVFILFTITMLGLKAEIKKPITEIFVGFLIFGTTFLFSYLALPDLDFVDRGVSVVEIGKKFLNDLFIHVITVAILLNSVLVSYILLISNSRE